MAVLSSTAMQTVAKVAATATAVASITALSTIGAQNAQSGGHAVNSAMTALCRNQTTTTASGDSSSKSNTSGSVDVNETALYIAQKFADAGYSKAATAGVLGNLVAESGIDPKKGEYSGGGGFGIAQWTPRSKIRAWLDANNMTSVSDDSLEGQTLMLVSDAANNPNAWNTYYLTEAKQSGIRQDATSLYDEWKNASDPELAAVAWMAGWERPSWTVRHEDVRRNSAKQYYDTGLNSITFTGKTTNTSTNTSGGSGRVSNEDISQCRLDGTVISNDDTSNTDYGSVGGAPTDTNTFAWMCNSNQKVCVAGDAGVFYPHLEYGYQCVWYAWNRLAMIHGNDGWTWVMGNGGDIWKNLTGNSAWEVSDSPKPGDGISGAGGAFTNSSVGHVGVVEEVQPDESGWKIRISEGNFGGTATFDTYNSRWLTKANAGDVHFFRNKSWAKAGS